MPMDMEDSNSSHRIGNQRFLVHDPESRAPEYSRRRQYRANARTLSRLILKDEGDEDRRNEQREEQVYEMRRQKTGNDLVQDTY